MTTAIQVLDYMRSTRGQDFYGEMQAHKLLYYAQAWTLAWDGEPLFDEPIEAWRDGPVVRSVRYYRPRPDASVSLTAQQKANIEAVLQSYADIPGRTLGEMTHQESPWKETRGDLPASASCSAPISHERMRKEYTRQSALGNGPRRRVVDVGRAARDDVLARAAAASDRWRRTLALLAE